MAEFFESRRLRYEIHKLCEKRWQIAEVVGDGREERAGNYRRSDFEELERTVLGQANALLAGGDVQAVRVLRERMREDGFTTTSEIFFREAGGRGEAPITVSRYDGAVAVCRAPVDLYSRDACKAIGILLRGYCDRHYILPLELLHFHPYIRKLNDSFSLIQGAIHQAATAQAKATAGDVKERAHALHGLIEAVEGKARDALAEKRLPTIEGGDIGRFLERMMARYEGEQLRFFTMVAVARHFQGAQSFLVKLDFALAGVAGALPAEIARLFDEIAAGCLDSSQLIMDLLGHQPNLATALVALAQLARGQNATAGEGSLAKLRDAIAAGKLPLTADAIWDRILRELARGRPLSRTDDKQEWKLLMKTSDLLLAECPAERADAISEQFKGRLRRFRDAAALLG
jgi:hypothetical protein